MNPSGKVTFCQVFMQVRSVSITCSYRVDGAEFVTRLWMRDGFARYLLRASFGHSSTVTGIGLWTERQPRRVGLNVMDPQVLGALYIAHCFLA